MQRFWRLIGVVLLSVLLAPAAEPLRSLTILHTNDLHARLTPDPEGRGGFAYLATAIRRERAAAGACLLVDAGDFVQGSPVSTIYRGLPVYEIVNRFGYDAAALGNHEFDYGWQMVPRFLRAARFPIVCGNVVDAEGRLLTGRAYVIKNVKGIRVALIGVMLDDLASVTKPACLAGWHTLPAVETIRKYYAEIHGRADLVVVLAHTGDTAVLDALPAAGVVIAGHVHGALEFAREKDGRVLVRSDSYGRELGRLDLQLDLAAGRIASWNWKRIRIDSRSLPPAGDVAAEVAKWEKRVTKIVDVRIGAARSELAGPALKILIEDAMRDATGADLAYMNPEGIRDRLRPGDLLARHVWNLMPFDNTVVAGRFRGEQLPRAVTQGRQIEAGRLYTLATNDFTADNQKTQFETTGLVFNDTGKLLRDVIIEYIRKRGNIP